MKENDVFWKKEYETVLYPDAISVMEERVGAIRAGTKPELVWLLEHPPLYTAGTSAHAEDLLQGNRFPVYESGRGGQYTYHGPGQRVAYVMLDLKQREPDVRRYVYNLEEWLIRTLRHFDVVGERREGRVGIWVEHDGRESKIAAIGVRVRQWVTYHGVALNVDPDLEHFNGIVPCGLAGYGVTSLCNLGKAVSMEAVDAALQTEFHHVFDANGVPDL